MITEFEQALVAAAIDWEKWHCEYETAKGYQVWVAWRETRRADYELAQAVNCYHASCAMLEQENQKPSDP